MTQDEIIRMAQESCDEDKVEAWHNGFWTLTQNELARFAALVAAAERNKLAAWMMAKGYATGHGDTTEDLLSELEWQLAEKLKMERESCARILDDVDNYANPMTAKDCAAAIRAREQK